MGNEIHNVTMSLVTSEELGGKHHGCNWVKAKMIVNTHDMADDE